VERGEVQPVEHQRRGGAEEEVVVPLQRRADERGEGDPSGLPPAHHRGLRRRAGAGGRRVEITHVVVLLFAARAGRDAGLSGDAGIAERKRRSRGAGAAPRPHRTSPLSSYSTCENKRSSGAAPQKAAEGPSAAAVRSGTPAPRTRPGAGTGPPSARTLRGGRRRTTPVRTAGRSGRTAVRRPGSAPVVRADRNAHRKVLLSLRPGDRRVCARPCRAGGTPRRGGRSGRSARRAARSPACPAVSTVAGQPAAVAASPGRAPAPCTHAPPSRVASTRTDSMGPS